MDDILEDEARLQKAIEAFDVDPIIRRFGSWAVTTYGVESLVSYYPIDLSRINEPYWLEHMSEKNWVDVREFAAALEFARDLLKAKQRRSINGRPLKVFLCHGSEDKPAMRELRNNLLTAGVEPWLDEEELLPGHDWRLEIQRALRRTDIALVCLSNKTVSKTGFVQREVKEALDAAAERPEGQIFIIPARLDHCQLPDSLRKWQWVDLYEQDGFDKLIRAFDAFRQSVST